MKVSTCNYFDGETKFTVIQKDGRCNYHKIDSQYAKSKLAPKGLCIEAYHNIYPHCLAMLYSADLSTENEGEDVLVRCPSVDSYVAIKIIKATLPLRIKVLNIMKSLVNRIYPVAISRRRISIEIAHVTGDCPNKHITGEIFEFNLGNLQITKNIIVSLGYEKELCPAAFDSLYPFLGWYYIAGKLPWTRKNSLPIVQCPDHKANVSFELD